MSHLQPQDTFSTPCDLLAGNLYVCIYIFMILYTGIYINQPLLHYYYYYCVNKLYKWLPTFRCRQQRWCIPTCIVCRTIFTTRATSRLCTCHLILIIAMLTKEQNRVITVGLFNLGSLMVHFQRTMRD